MSERLLLAAAASLAGLITGGGAATVLDFSYRAVRSGEAGSQASNSHSFMARIRTTADGKCERPSSIATASKHPNHLQGHGSVTPCALTQGGDASGSAGVSPAPGDGRRRRAPIRLAHQSVTGTLVRVRRRIVLLSLATSLLWGVATLRSLDLRQFLLMAVFGAVLLALTATDFERHLLPNRLLYPALLAALVLCWAWPGRTPLAGLAGGLAGLALMLAIYLALPGFGFGDVKLAALIGLILGFPAVIMGLLVGIVLGGIGATALLLTRRASLRSAIAYGPYLAGGAILELLLRR